MEEKNVQTICIDGKNYRSPKELHDALRRMLSLPEYYGGNADALYDCLSERAEPVDLWIFSRGEGPVEDAVRKAARVIGDLGGQVKEMEA